MESGHHLPSRAPGPIRPSFCSLSLFKAYSSNASCGVMSARDRLTQAISFSSGVRVVLVCGARPVLILGASLVGGALTEGPAYCCCRTGVVWRDGVGAFIGCRFSGGLVILLSCGILL